MAYNKINWENGQLESDGYVEVGGTQYTVTQPEYSGDTPVNADNLNHMDEGIEEAHKMAEKNIISLGLSQNTDITISQTNVFSKAPLDILRASVGNKLTYNTTNKYIVVGAGVSYVKVSAYALIRGIATSPKLHVQKNNADILVGYTDQDVSNKWGTCGLSPVLVEVQEGDIISLGVSAGATGTMTVGGTTFTTLTVEVVK